MKTFTKSPSLHVTERYHGLDAARAIALFIGIFHHAIESFVSYAKWDWIAQDSQQSLALDILFYVSHIFRMQAFFLMSGFFAHLLITRLGDSGFVRNRIKRLVLPFLIFWPILYFVTYHVWIWGIQYTKLVTYETALTKLPDYMMLSRGLPLMHLWFLYFLVLYCVAIWIFRTLIIRIVDRKLILQNRVDQFIHFCSQRWWGSLLLGIPMVVPMLGMTDGFGVDTSASGLIPRFAPFILYGLYFTLGWFLYRQAHLLKNIARFRSQNLVTFILLTILLIGMNLVLRDPSSPHAAIIQGTINMLYAFASVAGVYAFIGYMIQYFSKPSAGIRFLSDGAYWGYLIHLPLVGYFQILIAPYDWFWALKLLLILVPSTFILFVSYQYGVRNSIIGVLLNGARKSKPAKQSLVAAAVRGD